MNGRAANWPVLAQLMDERGADVAMLQEAVKSDDGYGGLEAVGDPTLGDDPWRMPMPSETKRRFASALAVRRSVSMDRHQPKQLADAAYGEPAISHPGQWVAAAIGEGSARTWVVSLYGMWDAMPDNGALGRRPRTSVDAP